MLKKWKEKKKKNALERIRNVKVFNNFIFNNSNEEKILGITIDNKLTFTSHLKS